MELLTRHCQFAATTAAPLPLRLPIRCWSPELGTECCGTLCLPPTFANQVKCKCEIDMNVHLIKTSFQSKTS